MKKPRAGQQNLLKTEIYDSWMRWIEGQEQGDLTAEDENAKVLKICDALGGAKSRTGKLVTLSSGWTTFMCWLVTKMFNKKEPVATAAEPETFDLS